MSCEVNIKMHVRHNNGTKSYHCITLHYAVATSKGNFNLILPVYHCACMAGCRSKFMATYKLYPISVSIKCRVMETGEAVDYSYNKN